MQFPLIKLVDVPGMQAVQVVDLPKQVKQVASQAWHYALLTTS